MAHLRALPPFRCFRNGQPRWVMWGKWGVGLNLAKGEISAKRGMSINTGRLLAINALREMSHLQSTAPNKKMAARPTSY